MPRTQTRPVRRAAAALAALLLALLLGACSQTPAPAAPTAPNAVLSGGGVVPFGTVVALDAGDSSGDDLDFAWSFDALPTGAAPVLSSGSASSTTFTPDRSGSYVVRVEVANTGGSDSATVTVQVEPVDVAGDWNLTLTVGGVGETYPMTITQSGTNLGGMLVGSGSSPYALDGTLEGDRITLALVNPGSPPITFAFEGTVDPAGSSMNGTFTATDGVDTIAGSFDGVRAP